MSTDEIRDRFLPDDDDLPYFEMDPFRWTRGGSMGFTEEQELQRLRLVDIQGEEAYQSVGRESYLTSYQLNLPQTLFRMEQTIFNLMDTIVGLETRLRETEKKIGLNETEEDPR